MKKLLAITTSLLLSTSAWCTVQRTQKEAAIQQSLVYECLIEATTRPELNQHVIEQLAQFMFGSVADNEPNALKIGFARHEAGQPMEVTIHMKSNVPFEGADESLKDFIRFLTHENNAQELAQCIKDMVNNPDAAEQYEDYCAFLKQEYNFPIEAMIDFYRKIVVEMKALNLEVSLQ